MQRAALVAAMLAVAGCRRRAAEPAVTSGAAVARVCVNARGEAVSVDVVRSSFPDELTRHVVTKLRGWRYPAPSDAGAQPSCSEVTYRLSARP